MNVFAPDVLPALKGIVAGALFCRQKGDVQFPPIGYNEKMAEKNKKTENPKTPWKDCWQTLNKRYYLPFEHWLWPAIKAFLRLIGLLLFLLAHYWLLFKGIPWLFIWIAKIPPPTTPLTLAIPRDTYMEGF